jgi:hypothetical protein
MTTREDLLNKIVKAAQDGYDAPECCLPVESPMTRAQAQNNEAGDSLISFIVEEIYEVTEDAELDDIPGAAYAAIDRAARQVEAARDAIEELYHQMEAAHV